jgi:hypothetical protein
MRSDEMVWDEGSFLVFLFFSSLFFWFVGGDFEDRFCVGEQEAETWDVEGMMLPCLTSR